LAADVDPSGSVLYSGAARSAARTRAASRRSRLLNEYGKFSRHRRQPSL